MLGKFELFIPLAQQMVKEGIVIAPWLTWGEGQHRISSRLLRGIEAKAKQFADEYWHPEWQVNLSTPFPISEDRTAEAYHEAVSGTAVYLSHLELGTLTVTEEMVNVAQRLTENFVEKMGPQQFVTFYLLTIIYENLQALHYYRSMRTEDFLRGEFHRPWGTGTLHGELDAAVATRAVEIDDTGLVKLTTYGQEILQLIKQVFVESGFLKFRSRLIRLNKFNDLDDIESRMQMVFINAPELRKRLIEFSQIQAGMTVLELGCGNGALTFGAGLYQVVGSHGRLIATDPSSNMLAAVKRKREQLRANWVDVVHAQAERLPFPDDKFDAVIGSAFLHFTKIDAAVKEIARVLKPGGTFSTFYPLHFPVRSAFFLEWFEPLLKLESPSKNPDVLPGPDTVPTAMQPYFEHVQIEDIYGLSQYTSPRAVVEMIVDIADMFEEQMATLPWRARQDFVKELIQRGEEICRKYPHEVLVEKHPGQMVRAVVRK